MSIEQPKVSVLIPAYNAEGFIRRTLESVIHQTCRDFEVLVLDDGSNDATGNIVKAIANSDPRISYYFQANRGLSNTRNRLVELARGEYVAFLDHDDEWMAQKLSLEVDFFEKNPHLGLVYSDAYIKMGNKIIGRCFKERRPVAGNVFYSLLFENFVPLNTVVMPKRVLLEFMPFNPDYEFSEEFDVFLRVSRRYSFAYLNEALAVYHRHGRNLSDSKLNKFIWEEFSILNYWLKQDPLIEKQYRGRLKKRQASLYAQKARYLLKNSQFHNARNEIFASFKLRPFNLAALKLLMRLFLNQHFFLRSHGQNSLCA